MTIRWEEQLRAGIDTIDEQHEALFAQFATLTEAITEGSCDRSIGDILDYLRQYADVHFSEEERLMSLHNYGGLEEQRQQHMTFRENLAKICEMAADNVPNKELAIRMDATLIRYTINHMRHFDQQLIEFIRDKEAAAVSTCEER